MADADRVSTVLVKAGLDVNAAAIDGTMPPHMAALLGNLAAADALIAEGAKVKATLPSSGDTPLLVAAAGIGNADAPKDGFDHAWRDGFFVKGQGRRFGSRAERLQRHRPASGGRREPRA